MNGMGARSVIIKEAGEFAITRLGIRQCAGRANGIQKFAGRQGARAATRLRIDWIPLGQRHSLPWRKHLVIYDV